MAPTFRQRVPRVAGKEQFHINVFPRERDGRQSWSSRDPRSDGGLVSKQTWGRVIFYVDSVDAVYDLARRNGLQPEFAPRDAGWGERYFHILDPSGHELAIAAPLHR